MATHGNQSTYKYGGNTVGSIDSIGAVKISAGKIDSSVLASTLKEFIKDLPEAGDLQIKGNFDPTDTTGQIQMLADAKSMSNYIKEHIITLPGGSATLTFNGFVSDVEVGPFENNKIPYTATIVPTSEPILGLTAVTGMSTVGFDNDVLIMPAFAIGKYLEAGYDYLVTITNGQTATIITPTDATSGEIITVTDSNGGSQIVTSGQPATAIAVSATAVTTIDVTISKAGYISKTYRFKLAVLAA